MDEPDQRLAEFFSKPPQSNSKMTGLATPNAVRVERVDAKVEWIDGRPTDRQQVDRVTGTLLWSLTVSGGEFNQSQPRVTIASTYPPLVEPGDLAFLHGVRFAFTDGVGVSPFFIADGISKQGSSDPLEELMRGDQ